MAALTAPLAVQRTALSDGRDSRKKAGFSAGRDATAGSIQLHSSSYCAFYGSSRWRQHSTGCRDIDCFSCAVFVNQSCIFVDRRLTRSFRAMGGISLRYWNITDSDKSKASQLSRAGAWHSSARCPLYSTEQGRRRKSTVVQAKSDDTSYLTMWKRARESEERERKEREAAFAREEEERRAALAESAAMARMQEKFSSILEVSDEERRIVERQAIVDRAAAALAAVEAVLADADSKRLLRQAERGRPAVEGWGGGQKLAVRTRNEPITGPTVSLASSTKKRPSSKTYNGENGLGSQSEPDRTLGENATPGPDFWAWAPPPLQQETNGRVSSEPAPKLKRSISPKAEPTVPFLDLDISPKGGSLDLPREGELATTDISSFLQSRAVPSLPPLQSLLEVQEKSEVVRKAETQMEWTSVQVPDLEDDNVSINKEVEQGKESGMNADGSRWWKETGVEERANGEVCRWTVVRGVSADGSREWEEKWWETTDQFDYKELGAEKSGRDATGGVWRETWREAMWQDAKNGLPHIEKSADKWARNGSGGEWHEKWWEHYDAIGLAEKWADKWSKIDLSTQLEPGHAHVWHERWGEEYDGKGSAMKYTDKWAERYEGDGTWTKWGDKWDERFDRNACGRKGGETWWEGGSGERWNRTWGEDHNNSGWVHKYGQASSGEHWDTSEPMDTWYEKKPHYGFKECFDHSRRLREVGRKENTRKRTL